MIELNDILISNGFRVIAAASFIGKHSFSKTLAIDRPNNKDFSITKAFADSVCENIENDIFRFVNIKGNRPYRNYYNPKDEANKSEI